MYLVLGAFSAVGYAVNKYLLKAKFNEWDLTMDS